MDSNIIKLDINNLSPYVRFIHLDNNNYARFYLPWRIIYDYEIYFITEGRMTVKLENETIDLVAGDIHFMKPFIWHKREIPFGSKCTYYSVHFDFLYMENQDFDPEVEYKRPCDEKVSSVEPNSRLLSRTIFEPKDIDLPFKCAVAEFTKCHDIVSEMLFIFNEKPFGYELSLKSLFLQLLNLLVRQQHNTDERLKGTSVMYHKEIILKVKQYLYDHYNEKINFSKIAKNFGISPAYLRAIFKKNEKISLMDFLLNIRIERAKQLLTENKYTVTQISEQLGYPDVQTFSRQFKKKTNYSPLGYKNHISKV